MSILLVYFCNLEEVNRLYGLDVFGVDVLIVLAPPLAVHILYFFVCLRVMSLRCDFLNQGDRWRFHDIQHWNVFLLFLNLDRYAWQNISRKAITNFCYSALFRVFTRNRL